MRYQPQAHRLLDGMVVLGIILSSFQPLTVPVPGVLALLPVEPAHTLTVPEDPLALSRLEDPATVAIGVFTPFKMGSGPGRVTLVASASNGTKVLTESLDDTSQARGTNSGSRRPAGLAAPLHAALFDTYVSGVITQSTTWTLAGSPYTVTSDVTVPNGVTLTVEAGVELLFDSEAGLFVHGALRSVGTTAQPITFTTSSTTPAPGQWEGIFFEPESDDGRNLLEYVTVSYAGQGVVWHGSYRYTGIGVYDASPTIRHTTVYSSARHGVGLYAHGVVVTATLTGNTIVGNTGHAVYVRYDNGAGLPVGSGNIAAGNGGHDGVAVEGTVGYSTTFPSGYDLPLAVVGYLGVNSGVELTVEAGAEVLFESGAGLHVYGALRAVGTAAQPITFTTSSTTPAPGQWEGIFFEPESDDGRNLLEYVTVSYAGWSVSWCNNHCRNTAIGVCDASPTIRHATISHSGNGLWASQSQLALSDSVLRQNAYSGVELYADSAGVFTPTLTGNTFVSNTYRAIVVRYADGGGLPTLSGNSAFGNGGHDGVAVMDRLGYSTTFPSGYDLPLVVVEYLGVNSGVELTVEAGAEVLFDSYTGLYVHGALRAVGTAAQPITFTTSSTLPLPGQWQGIFFEPDSDDGRNLLEHVTVSYAGGEVNWCSKWCHTAIGVCDASPTIRHATIFHSAGNGLWASQSQLALSDSVLRQNAYSGVELYADSAGVFTPTLTGNTFVSNTYRAIVVRYADGGGLPTLSGNSAFGNGGHDGVAVMDRLGYSTTFPSGYDLPLVVVEYLGVNSGVELTVEAGAEVLFESGAGLHVYGALRAVGTAAQPITFTTSSTTPAPGQWEGIFFEPESDDGRNLLEYVTVSYAGGGQVNWCGNWCNTAIGVCDASPTIRHTTVRYSLGDGIWIGDNSNVDIRNCTIEDNGDVGIRVENSDVTVEDTSLLWNVNFGIANVSPGPDVQATHNWWGHPSGPYHPTTNPDGLGDQVSDDVAYAPWLVSPPGPPRRSTALALGQPVTDTVGQLEYQDYHLVISPGLSLLVEVVPLTGTTSLGVYGRVSELPLWTHHDVGAEQRTPRGAYELPVATTQAGVYYISVYGRSVSGGGGGYRIAVNPVERHLSDVSPRSAGNAGETTLSLSGVPFAGEMEVELCGVGLPTHTAESVTLVSPTELWARFDLKGATAGVYDVVAIWPGGGEASLPDAFTTTEGSGAHLEAELVTPPFVRPGRSYVLWVEYANTGDADMVAPVFVVSSPDGVPIRLTDVEPFEDQFVQVLGINAVGCAGRLPPGTSHRIPIYFHVPPGTPGHAMLDFDLATLISDTMPIDWEAVEDEVRPPDVSPEVWDIAWPILTDQIGDTWGDYRQTLADDAGYLSSLGRTVYSVRDLFRFEVRKALGMNPRTILAGQIDAYAPAPGMSLEFGRVFPGSLEGRFYLGPLGRGWSHSYDIYLEEQSDGDVLVHWPGGFTRLFRSDGDGTYTALPGDYGTLTRDGDIFELTEKDGTLYRFRADGQLDYVEDLNGNRVTAVYDGGGRLIEIGHSSSYSFTLEYNAHGRISRLTDHAGRATEYGYDAAGEHLLTVTAPGDRVTDYTYNFPVGQPADHAPLSIAYPDGTHQYYAYEALGRLSEEQLDGGAERISYTYDALGRIHVTDAAGETAVISPDEYGRLSEVRDALGRELGQEHGADFTLSTLTDPAGQAYEFDYDLLGNVIGATDPLGHRITLGYDTRFSQIALLEDARGNQSTFDYDDAGNLTILTYPDGSSESITYDSVGNPITYTSRSSDVINYSYNAQGQLLRKDYPDGSWVAYTYDGASNMTSASDVSGTITMEYDGDTDLLTRITYPSGHYFEYSHNDAGQRIQRVDQNGHELNYEYDAAGRLLRLCDENGADFVTYEYDGNGRLLRESKGNGTYTTYEYDAAGQLLHMVNYASDDTGQSRFDYTYDANGNRTSMTTLEGITAYEYDAIGQLVGVTYPDGRHVVYEYDAAGNRFAVIDDGAITHYTTNNLNQYTQMGDATYTYDDNGNMTSKTDASGTITYEYDFEDRLIRVTTPVSGTWEYTYDALGNRVTVEHNGSVTRYIHDHIGLVDVAAEYDGGGALVARYVHGQGLVARIDAAGDPAYYAFDATGHTRQLTNDSGAVANVYDYTPFGIPLQANEIISNPFQYVGRFGVMDEGNGLGFMRARYYMPLVGRFIAVDPIGFAGGISNLYNCAANSPMNRVDPTGLRTNQDLNRDIALGGDTFGFIVELGRELVSNPKHYWYWRWTKGMTPFAHKRMISLWSKAGAIGRIANGIGILASLPSTISAWHQYGETASKYIRGETTLLDLFHDWGVAGLSTLGLIPGLTGVGAIGTLADEASLQWAKLIFPSTGFVDTISLENITPQDPNEKIGPAGLGEHHLVSAGDELHYTIYFENVPTATAPAQEVFVVDALDSDLDWGTFQITEIAFGDQVIAVPAETDQFYTRDTILDYRDEIENWWVDVTAQLNYQTGQMNWTLRTLDPETGELPQDPLAGFLPPNDETGRGEGHVAFSVKPRADVTVGTLITNTASIVFDTNDPIETNEVWNTIGVLADLALIKTDSSDPVTAGSNLTYTIVIANDGPDTASNVVVMDTLPVSVTFVSSSASQGSCSGTSTVTCDLGTIASSVSVTVTIVVIPIEEGTLNNTASVVSGVTDPNTANNKATVSTSTTAASPPDYRVFLPLVLKNP